MIENSSFGISKACKISSANKCRRSSLTKTDLLQAHIFQSVFSLITWWLNFFQNDSFLIDFLPVPCIFLTRKLLGYGLSFSRITSASFTANLLILFSIELTLLKYYFLHINFPDYIFTRTGL